MMQGDTPAESLRDRTNITLRLVASQNPMSH
jgi:hypothetical protein